MKPGTAESQARTSIWGAVKPGARAANNRIRPFVLCNSHFRSY